MSESKLYPQCPYCRKVRTINKSGAWYICTVCHRMMRKFGYAAIQKKGTCKHGDH